MATFKVDCLASTAPEASMTKARALNLQASTNPKARLGRVHIAKTVFTRHPIKFPAIIGLAILSPLFGLILVGWQGVLVGWVLNGVSLWLGYSAVRAEVVKTIYADV